MTKFKIKDVQKYMVDIYEVEAETKEEAFEKYINELAGSLEPLNSYYEPDAEETIEVVDDMKEERKIPNNPILNDLSFSGIVDTIQHDRDKGRQAIIECMAKIRAEETKLEKLNNLVYKSKGEISSMKTGIKRVMKHLGIQLPCIISTENGLFEIDKAGRSIVNDTIEIIKIPDPI